MPSQRSNSASVSFTLNGSKRQIEIDTRSTLLEAIRDELNLTGTHKGCDEAVCGSCTVILNGNAVYSCTMFAVEAEGNEITTIEGLTRDGKLDPLQKAFVEHDAIQCAFCTSGQILAAKAFIMGLKYGDTIEECAIKEALSGNLCRCGCYNKIVEAVKSVGAGLVWTE